MSRRGRSPLAELEMILREAHARMDRLGYPPAPRHQAPIGTDNSQAYAVAIHSEDEGRLAS